MTRRNRLVLSLLSFLTIASVASATAPHFVDLGFRYKDGKCVNARGEEGLNPSYPGQCSDLRGIVANGLDWSNVDFSGSRFDNSDLQRTKFGKSIFNNAVFEGANLSGVDFIGAKFNSVNFQRATLVNIKLAEAELRAVNLDKVDLSNTDLSYADIQNSSLREANLTSGVFESAQLSGTDFSGATLVKASLRNANLAGATLSKAIFTGANLTKAVLQGCKGVEVVFQDARIEGADWRGAAVPNADFTGAILRNTNVEDTDLTGSNFRFADLEGVKTSRANFKGARFNQRTILPFPMEQALSRGMLFNKTAAILNWTKRGHSPELPNTLKALTDTATDVVVENYEGAEATVLIDKLKNADIFLLTYQYGEETGFPAAVGPALKAFITSGGTLIATGDDEEFLKKAGLFDRRVTTFTREKTKQVPILIPSHPLARGFGANIYISNATHVFEVKAGEGVDVMGTTTEPIVIAKTIGKGNVIWIGYDYEEVNEDAVHLLKNAILMAMP